MEENEFKEKMQEKSKILGFDFSVEQISKFYKYMNMLIEWNEKINLTAIIEPNEIILKHFIDSLTIYKDIPNKLSVVDVGTGAGFPGIPLAIMNESLKFTLVDSLNKRLIFLQEVINELNLKNVELVHARAEEFGQNKKYREKFDISTSRAVANLSTLSEYLIPLVKENGKIICMKASEAEEEIEQAKKAINVLGGTIKNVETFDLPICYRCAKSHLSRVNREYGIPILPCDDAPMGFVKTIDKNKISEYAKAGDMVISRKNKWIAEVVLDLARNGTPIFIEDKEMVGAIKRQILSSKCTSVGTLKKFLQKVISNYNKKLFEIVSKNVREGGHEEEHLEDYVREHKKTGRVFRHIHINHGPDIEKAIEAVKSEVSKNEFIRHKYSTRFLSIKLLENDPDIERIVRTLPNADEIFHVRDKMSKRVQDTMNEDCESAITDAKYGFISGALKETFTDNHLEQAQTTKVLDSIVTHRVWGFPIFFLFMYLMFEGTFVIGEYPMMGIEWLVEQIGDLLRNNMAEGPFKDLLIDGIIGGVGAVIVFLPNILILYFCISLMEDSGYMARAAFIMDKIMHKMGLHGKSFIPLIMGFGCNVPAIIASRTIENRKSRLITMLVNPLMSCSARLPIYLLLVGAFFPNNASLVLLSIYVIGIVLAVVMARLFSKFLVKGDDTPFVMELPPYRMPTAKSIFRHTWEKGAQYLKKMGGIIMIASIIIWFLGYYPNHDAYETVAEQQENSYIGQLGRGIEPVIKPLGFDWKLGIGLLSGVGAKELVVSTLGVLYADDPDADSVSLAERIPITPLVAFCYMLFVLIYFPCIAAIAAIKQESGSWKWALFAACYTTGLAWLVSFAVYQIGGLFV